MKKFLLAFLTLLLTVIVKSTVFADFDTMDCLVDVYVDSENRWWTVYDVSLIPADEISGDEPNNTQSSPFNLLNKSLIGTAPTMLSSQVGDLNMKISLLYDNKYSEKVLLSGKSLTIELLAQNIAEGTAPIQVLTVFYTADNRLVTMDYMSDEVGAELKTITSTVTVPKGSEVSTAKIMIWNSFGGLTPYTAPVLLTLNSNDYFGDDYTVPQPLSNRSEAIGSINDEDDIDIFEFTAQKDGLYIFESYGTTDTYAKLYNSTNMATAVVEDDNGGADNNFRLSHKLTAGQKYYLYIYGNDTGDYIMRSMYAIGNIIGTVSPVKYYDGDSVFNSLIEAKCTLARYDTGEFIATMHLKDWSQSDSNYAQFSLTGVSSDDYLFTISRPGYLSRYLKRTLNDNVVDLGAKELLAGDVNGDGIINSIDASIITSLGNKTYGDSLYQVSADLNGDKIINSADLDLLTPNMNKDSNVYNENVNVISFNTSVSNYILTVSGRAKPYSVINGIVFFGDYSISDQDITCDINGDFSFEATLSKTGTYYVTVNVENRAFDVTKTIISN